jgi:hypothetical protein
MAPCAPPAAPVPAAADWRPARAARSLPAR